MLEIVFKITFEEISHKTYTNHHRFLITNMNSSLNHKDESNNNNNNNNNNY